MITKRKYEKQNFTPEQEEATALFNDTLLKMLASYGFDDNQIDEVSEHLWNELDTEVLRVITRSK